MSENGEMVVSSSLMKATTEVLTGIGLSSKEIEMYFKTTGKGPMSVGEIAILTSLHLEEVREIGGKFVEKGLYKEIAGATYYFQALPPYAAIIESMTKFEDFLKVMKEDAPKNLGKQFRAVEEKTEGVSDLLAFEKFVVDISDHISTQIQGHKKNLDDSLQTIMDQSSVIEEISNLRDNSVSLVGGQMEQLDGKFAAVKEKITENLDQSEVINEVASLRDKSMQLIQTQLTGLSTKFQSVEQKIMVNLDQADTIREIASLRDQSNALIEMQMGELGNKFKFVEAKILKNLKKLRLGAILKAVENVVGTVMTNELNNIKQSFQVQFASSFNSVLEDLIVKIQKIPQELSSVSADIQNMFGEIKNVFEVEFIKSFDSVLDGLTKNIQKIPEELTEVSDKIGNMFGEIKNVFEVEFVKSFDSVLEELVIKISDIPKELSVVSNDIRTMFDNTEENITTTLGQTHKKIQGVSSTIFSSFATIRDSFSTNVVASMDGMIGQIIEKTDITTSALREFWIQSKQSVTASMKDVWFIRSPEGMKAQIASSVSNAKMRILLIAPTLADVDFEPLFKLARHVNIRISTYINIEDPVDKARLEELDQHENIAYRHRNILNLWSINKDYEEAVIGIVSKPVGIKSDSIEVAGIGSIISEHIKIFVPILEDAWMSSKKDKASFGRKAGAFTASIGSARHVAPKKVAPKPKVEKKADVVAPTPATVSSAPKIKKPKLSENDIAKEVAASIKVIEEKPEDKMTVDDIKKMMSDLQASLVDIKPREVQQALMDIRVAIQGALGFSKILRFIQNWENQIKMKPSIDENTQHTLTNLINSWMSQL